MSDPRESNVELSVLDAAMIGELAPVSIRHPRGTYALTPASSVLLRAISEHQRRFTGRGIDWGCGTGCLGIVAARIPTVTEILSLDLSEADVMAASENVALNGVADKVRVFLADSFSVLSTDGQQAMEDVRGQVNFVIANPPASQGDDGFQLRRVIIAGAPQYLKSGASVFMQISIQYGWKRILDLAGSVKGFVHRSVLASTPWVPFDLARDDLRGLLDEYVAEEERGGLEYAFGDPRSNGDTRIDAHTALELFRESGVSPLTKWQVHLFGYEKGHK